MALAIPCHVLAGPTGAVAALAGFACCAFGGAAAGMRGAAMGGAGLVAALALALVWPGWWAYALLCAALCAAAGIEAAARGTRIAIIVMLGVTLVFASGAPTGLPALAMAGLGAATGAVVMGHLALWSVIPPQRLSRAQGLRLALFLSLGVTLSLILGLRAPQHGHWIAVLFMSRALVPFGQRRAPLMRYGTGAALGVSAALLIEAVHPPGLLRVALAIAAAVLGLRFMLHARPIGPAMTTLSVLLGTAPTMRDALFRAEAVAAALGIVVLAGLVLDRLWLEPRSGPNDVHRATNGSRSR
ncbi:hypothetical protein [Paracoccus tibetensis]|uniref:hypothetical protein n=1 Tax=Paracoccus tibetensis TaxID=336292 RepID=UPI0011146AFB|nr:hypothetical protein [Paracoccus tibetensis]